MWDWQTVDWPVVWLWIDNHWPILAAVTVLIWAPFALIEARVQLGWDGEPPSYEFRGLRARVIIIVSILAMLGVLAWVQLSIDRCIESGGRMKYVESRCVYPDAPSEEPRDGSRDAIRSRGPT